jgi:hypothetical protein
MSKIIKKSRTEGFLGLPNFNAQPSAKLPSPEEVNQTLAKIVKQPEPVVVIPAPVVAAPIIAVEAPTPLYIAPNPIVSPNVPPAQQNANLLTETAALRRVPLTTAVTPELRAKLEVAALHRQMTVSELLHDALNHYFEQVAPVTDTNLVSTFAQVYGKKEARKR